MSALVRHYPRPSGGGAASHSVRGPYRKHGKLIRKTRIMSGRARQCGGAVERVGGAYTFVACLGHLTVDVASLSRRKTIPTSYKDTSTFTCPTTRMTDSTIAPPQSQRFSSTNVLLQLDTRKGAMKNTSSHIVLFATDYRLMTSGWQGAPYFRRYGRGLVPIPAILLKKSWGGYGRTTPTEPSHPLPPHGRSRWVQATSAWSVKTLRAPSRLCSDARICGVTNYRHA